MSHITLNKKKLSTLALAATAVLLTACGGGGGGWDAAVEARVEVMAGSVPDEAVYLDSLRRRRDLSVLLLLDLSASTNATVATTGQSTLLSLIREASLLLGAAILAGAVVWFYSDSVRNIAGGGQSSTSGSTPVVPAPAEPAKEPAKEAKKE